MYSFTRCKLCLPQWNPVIVTISVAALMSLVARHVWLFAPPRTAAHQAPPSMGILQARMLEWVATPSSRGSSQGQDRTQVSHTAGRLPSEPPGKPSCAHNYMDF